MKSIQRYGFQQNLFYWARYQGHGWPMVFSETIRQRRRLFNSRGNFDTHKHKNHCADTVIWSLIFILFSEENLSTKVVKKP